MLPGSPPPTTLRPRVSAVAPSSTSALSASSAARPTYMTSSTYANTRAICSRSRATPGASSAFPLFAPATPVSSGLYLDARVLCLCPAGSSVSRGRGGGAAGPVPSKRPSEVAHPDGAQPPRGSERVPRGRGGPSPGPPTPTTLSVDLASTHARFFSAVGAAEDAVAVLDAMADDPAVAVLADRGDLLDGALERVVRPHRVLIADFHRPSIVVAADVTPSHWSYPLSVNRSARRPRAGARPEAGSPRHRCPPSKSRRLLRSCCRAARAARPRSPRARGPRDTARARSTSRGRCAARSRGASRTPGAACTRASRPPGYAGARTGR